MQRDVTPLMMAAGYSYTPIVELLLRRGADPARVDGDGNRALDYALTGTLYRATLFECQDSTVRVLIAAHAPRVINRDSRRWRVSSGAMVSHCCDDSTKAWVFYPVLPRPINGPPNVSRAQPRGRFRVPRARTFKLAMNEARKRGRAGRVSCCTQS